MACGLGRNPPLAAMSASGMPEPSGSQHLPTMRNTGKILDIFEGAQQIQQLIGGAAAAWEDVCGAEVALSIRAL